MHFRTLFRSFARAQKRTLALSVGLAVCLTGCSFHAHYGAGTGNTSSAAAEPEERPAAEGPQRTSSHHEGRRSPAGRDSVVRVTSDEKPAVEHGKSGADQPARGVVRPSGDAPAGSEGGSGAASSAGGSGSGSSGSAGSGGGSGSGAAGAGGSDNGQPSAYVPPEETPAAGSDKPSSDAPSTGKESRKNPTEPHEAVPSRKPRKTNREGTSTNKEGRRE